MKIKLNDLLIVIYLILLSIVLKEFLYIPLSIAVLVFLLGSRLEPGIKNLIYISIATLPFIPFFVFFIFYIPFLVFGTVLENPTFIKRYVLGFAITHVVRLVVYYPNVLGVPIGAYFIMAILAVFLSIAYYVFIRKKGTESLKGVFSVNSEDYKILLVTLFFLFLVTNVMYNGTSLHTSNATEIYYKQSIIIKTIESYGFFPQYDPGTGMGEQLFLTDSPLHFTKDILVMSTILLKNWFSALLIYNSHSMFILWMTILGAAILLKQLLSMNGKNNSGYTVYFIILGSLAIGLSFQFVRILESLKSFSAHPINMLLFAMIISKPKKAAEWFIVGYLLVLSYMVHVIQAIGVWIFAFSIFVVVYAKDIPSIKEGASYLLKNKWKVAFVLVMFLGVMFAYTLVGASYDDYIREHPRGLFNNEPLGRNFVNYIKDYFTNNGVNPFSIKYPDLNRLDTKESGFFLSVIGGLAVFYVLLNLKNEKLKMARIFAVSFIVQFLLYDFITNLFNMGTLEPGYRIILPYTVVLLSVCIAAAFDSFNSREIRTAFLVVFIAFLLHSMYYARINLDNIHSEQIISQGSLKNEMDFIRSLPNDGRFITYGLFSNAVDPGMAYNTGHYFTRYQYNLWSEINNIYDMLHTTHSFGDFPGIYTISGTEMSNYLNLGGYRYLFLNICHPVGNAVIQKLYPNYTTPIYQNPNYQCSVILQVNGTNYAEEITLLKNVNKDIYKNETGYKYVTVSSLKRFDFANPQKSLEYAENKEPMEPKPLSFNRINPQLVEIHGNFNGGEWVVFKEEFFPRWKAYMNNMEIPVYPTNFNMIAVRAVKGNVITLKYDIVKKEKMFSLASLIAVAACSLFFVGLIRYN